MIGDRERDVEYGAMTPGIVNYRDETPSNTPARGESTENYGLPPRDSSLYSGEGKNQFSGTMLLQPNIGESNAAIGEDSLRESLRKIRLINLSACALVIILEIPNFLGNVFFLKPARAILGIYLTLFAILLCGYELDMLFSEQIELYFGILYHPIGRSAIIFLMGGLAIGQGGILDFLLGFVFIGSAVYTVVTYIWYPEYRRRTEERPELFDEIKGAEVLTRVGAKPAGENLSLLKAGENLPFLRKVLQQK
mmetsp:Transcript_13170/g.15076  ORF Transcript_13170/g.15076 Transcript_13170/m.15076 type:complete len:251 (+) Transcript_13170:63-815(+)